MYTRVCVYVSEHCTTVQVPGVITECVDVADLDAVQKAVESVAPIHLLVNNAGVAQLQHILDVTPEVYDK